MFKLHSLQKHEDHLRGLLARGVFSWPEGLVFEVVDDPNALHLRHWRACVSVRSLEKLVQTIFAVLHLSAVDSLDK